MIETLEAKIRENVLKNRKAPPHGVVGDRILQGKHDLRAEESFDPRCLKSLCSTSIGLRIYAYIVIRIEGTLLNIYHLPSTGSLNRQ